MATVGRRRVQLNASCGVEVVNAAVDMPSTAGSDYIHAHVTCMYVIIFTAID